MRSIRLGVGWQESSLESNRFDWYAPPIFRSNGEPKWQPSDPRRNPTVAVGSGLGEVKGFNPSGSVVFMEHHRSLEASASREVNMLLAELLIGGWCLKSLQISTLAL